MAVTTGGRCLEQTLPEQSIPRSYLEQLNGHYQEWIKSYRLGPLLVVPSDEVDFVHERGDFNRMLLLIEGKLLELGYRSAAPRQ